MKGKLVEVVLSEDDIAKIDDLSLELYNFFPILRYFEYSHLPMHIQYIPESFKSIAFCLATTSIRHDKNLQETEAGLRKLLEAKDCFVRSNL